MQTLPDGATKISTQSHLRRGPGVQCKLSPTLLASGIDANTVTTGHIGAQICSHRHCGPRSLRSCLSASLHERQSRSSSSASSSAPWSSRSPARWVRPITSPFPSLSDRSSACMAHTRPSVFEPSWRPCGPLFFASKLETSSETASPRSGRALPTFPTTCQPMLASPPPVY